MGYSFPTEPDGEEEDSDINYRKRFLIGVVVFLVVSTAVTVPSVLLTRKKDVQELPDGETDRIDCPISTGTKDGDKCIKQGCRWNPVNQGPWCYLPKSSNHIVNATRSPTHDGFSIPIQYYSNVSIYSNPHRNIYFQVHYDSDQQLTFQFRFDAPKYAITTATGNRLYEVIVSDIPGSQFHFKIVRTDNNVTMLDSSISGLVLEEGFLQIASRLATRDIYGLGVNHHQSFRRDLDYKIWPLFTQSNLISPDNKYPNGQGFHPFYLCIEEGGSSHALLFNSISAIEYSLLPEPGILLRTIGEKSTLSFTLFIGKKPRDTMRTVAKTLGSPELIPYWSLGLQIAPAGDPKLIVNETIRDKIPIDAVQIDLRLWQDGKIFEPLDSEILRYMTEQTTKNNLHWIIVLDPGIAVENYSVHDSGVKGQHFIKWSDETPASERSFPDLSTVNPEDGVMYGSRSSTKPRAFPNFFNKATENWWTDLITQLKKSLPFDGVFVVNNEPLSAGTNGKSCQKSEETCWELQCPKSKYDGPLYQQISMSITGQNISLSNGTLCMAGSIKTDTETRDHYDVHNVYGMTMATISHKACQMDGRRCLTVSQSTASIRQEMGSIGHYVVNVQPQWEDMKATVRSMLEFSLFGVPYTGARICAGKEYTASELCMRWMELAIFYPLAKIKLGGSEADVSKMAPRDVLLDKLKTSIRFRYSLLPYFYTVFYEAHLNGDMLIRPLFYEFPEDEKTKEIEEQFMWGSALMVAPIMDEITGTNDWTIYYPKDVWYKLRDETSSLVPFSGEMASVQGITEVPVFVRGGSILPCHEPDVNVAKSREKPLILKVFPKNRRSEGFLYWDDGISVDSIASKKYLTFEFKHTECRLDIRRLHDNSEIKDLEIGEFRIHNAGWADEAIVNGAPANNVVYLSGHRILRILVSTNLSDPNVGVWSVQWDNGGSCTYSSNPVKPGSANVG